MRTLTLQPISRLQQRGLKVSYCAKALNDWVIEQLRILDCPSLIPDVADEVQSNITVWPI
jgi:hypothetical protein